MNCNLFKIYVHRPDEFPLVRDRGFALGPGQEMFVSVDAVGEIFHNILNLYINQIDYGYE